MIERRILLAVLAVLILLSFFVVSCSKETGSYNLPQNALTIRQGVLTIGMVADYPPMEYYAEDGKTLLGFDVELGKAIAGKMGLEPNFIDTSWNKLFSELQANRFDCIVSSVTITPAREEAYNFSKPYISNSLAMVLPRGSHIASSPEQAANLQVGFQSGTTADEYMQDLGRYGLSFIPRMYDSMIQCFLDLQNGRIDVVMTDLLVAYEFGSYSSPFEIVWTSTEAEEFGICIRKGRNTLTEAVNQALDELWADGTLLQISQETFGMDLVTSVRN